MSESRIITVRVTDGTSSQNIEIDLETALDSDLEFLWQTVKNEDAREELKLRTGMDPAKNFSNQSAEDLQYFLEWTKKYPERYQERYVSKSSENFDQEVDQIMQMIEDSRKTN